MSEMDRRQFLTRGWQFGVAVIAAAGAWTTWDIIHPRLSAGLGGPVRTVPEEAVPDDSALTVLAARSYLTELDGEVVALSEVCPHLGCRVEWCEPSGQFECACHGSTFNRIGEYRSGPSPRGMDRHPNEVVDGVVVVDTGDTIAGDPPGEETINEPQRGPSCIEGTH